MIFGYIDPGTGITVIGFGGWLLSLLLGGFGLFALYLKKGLKFFKKFKKITMLTLFLLATSIILLLIGLYMTEKKSDFNQKIIILGYDGLCPNIISDMMKKGDLPNFSKLKKQGALKKLETTNPAQSPVAWTGFSTGLNPGKHGIFDFIKRDPKTYGLTLSLSNYQHGKPKKVVKSKRLWDYTSDKKIPTTIIGCPVTFPPDKIYGKMLSGMGVPDILGTEGTFTYYTSEPITPEKDVGGKVFSINKANVMILNLIGPSVKKLFSKADNLKVPMSVVLSAKEKQATLQFQKIKTVLKVGEWSDWQHITFNLGLFKKTHGIFKFYLAEIEPAFKLYMTPINFDPNDPLFPISYPKGYSKKIAKTIGNYYTQGMPMDTWAVNENRLTEDAFIDQALDIIDEKEKMLNLELAQFEKGLLYCYFESPDIIQHMFWRYIDEQHPLYDKNAPQKYKEIIYSWYKKLDKILGTVMTQISDDDTIIVLSDHGFNTFRRAAHINSWLRKNGYLSLTNDHSDSGAELLADIDWSNTKAYALGFGSIYINELGREQYGIVAPGQEKNQLQQEIMAKLLTWRDAKYQTSIINKIYTNKDIFNGPYAEAAPDLLVGFNIGYRASWQTALGGVPSVLIEDNLKKWSGSHLFDPSLIPGILFTNHKIQKETPNIIDITPTILKMIGYSEKELERFNLDGRILF